LGLRVYGSKEKDLLKKGFYEKYLVSMNGQNEKTRLEPGGKRYRGEWKRSF